MAAPARYCLQWLRSVTVILLRHKTTLNTTPILHIHHYAQQRSTWGASMMINRKEDKTILSSAWNIHYNMRTGTGCEKTFSVKGSSNGPVIDIAAVTLGGEY